MHTISFSKINIKKKDLSLINKILLSGKLTHGKYTDEFEQLFCKYTGTKYAITLSSCTAGLHLSCLALGIGTGDEVIVPAMTHTATAHAVEYTGAKAIFADIQYNTGNITDLDILDKISKKTKAVIIVHMAGLSVDMDGILKITKKHNIHLIEDCAHGLGTTYKKKHVGNYGKCASFSFYPTKQITTGEGGMFVTNQKNIYNKVKQLKAFGIDSPPNLRRRPGIYDVKSLGFNYRMTEFQAALGLIQLKKYKIYLSIRKRNAKYLINQISNLSNIFTQPFDMNHSYFVLQIFFKNKLKRNFASFYLKKNNLGFSIHYARPLPLMSFYRKRNKEQGKFKNSSKYSNNSISLPVYNKLTKNDLNFISNKLKKLDAIL